MHYSEETSWKPVSIKALIFWIIAYGLFMLHAGKDEDGFLLLDHINLPFHEAGHIFLNPLGEFIGFCGGTIFQLLIPLAIMINFWIKGETIGFAFCLFWFGENFLNIARYMADARDMMLPLVGGGDHDWNYIFSELGVLHKDREIAGVVWALGWVIMVSAVVRLILKSEKKQRTILDTDKI